MDQAVKDAIYKAVSREPLAQTMQMKLVELDLGCSCVEMNYNPATMNNIYQRAHGGAIFALIDEAFETASQTHGTIAVALNVNVSYVASPDGAGRLYARAREVSRSKKIATYDIRVSGENEQLIAICQAMAYQTGKPIPFIR